MLSEAQFDWLARFPQQIVTDPEFSHQFAQQYRFCADHAVEFARLASFRSIALLHQAMAADTLSRWDEGTPLYPCPLCLELTRQAEEWIALLAQALTDRALREVYRSGKGFCLPHLRAICRRADLETAAFLRETERAFWRELEGQLHIASYKAASPEARDEPWGEERKAPARALEKLTGRPGLPLEIS